MLKRRVTHRFHGKIEREQGLVQLAVMPGEQRAAEPLEFAPDRYLKILVGYHKAGEPRRIRFKWCHAAPSHRNVVLCEFLDQRGNATLDGEVGGRQTIQV